MPSLKHRMRMKHPNRNQHQFLELMGRYNVKVEKYHSSKHFSENFKRFIRLQNRTVVMIDVNQSRKEE